MSEDVFSTPDNGTRRGNGPKPEEGPGEDKPYRARIGHAGRYVLPDPYTGREKHWSRASTIAKTISDTYHLERWKLRMVAKGLGLRHDLAMLAANLDVTDDKNELQNIADTAMEVAGANIGANMGTALHGYAERADSGEDLSEVSMSGATRKSLNAYTETMTKHGLETDPRWMERVVLNTELGIVGRLDRVLMDPEFWQVPRIGDLKTQKTMEFGGLDIAIQLAIYANAEFAWNEDTGEWEEFPTMNADIAHVMHLPAQGSGCKIYDVDIATGWKCAKLAMYVRTARNASKSLITENQSDRYWRARINAARSRDDLSVIWQEAQAAGEWSSSLEQYGKAHLKTLPTTDIKAIG